jgi:hypothetical protein
MQLSELRALIRLTATSTADWPDATLDAWIADGIRLYSAQFPRRWRKTQTLTTGTQAYALPRSHGFRGIISVEYPTGEDPQSFLTEAAEWSDSFQDDDEVYALRGISDATAIESDSAIGYIVFAETVATGQSAVIEYWGDHPVPTAGDNDAQITVPPQHIEALIAFCEFRAHWELETDEAYTATSVAIIMSQLGENARRAWNRYKEVMSQLEYLGHEPLRTPQPTWSYL